MLQEETLQFFRELRENNHKDWFDVNRPRYEKAKKDYHKLVGELLAGMQQNVPELSTLQVKDCVFRINRDIRFSKDKTPYKTHLGIVMNPIGRRMENAAYYIHIDEEKGCFAGGGIHMPPGPVIKKVRKEVDVFWDDLQKILKDRKFAKTYADLDRSDETTLIRPPKGYSHDNPAIEYLKLKSYTATHPFPNRWLSDPDGVQKVCNMLLAAKPLIDFLNRGISDQ